MQSDEGSNAGEEPLEAPDSGESADARPDPTDRSGDGPIARDEALVDQDESQNADEPLSPAEQLKAAAHAFIKAALPALAGRRVVPASVYRRFLRVGSDYEGHVVMGLPEFGQLESAVQRWHPERYGSTTGLQSQSGNEFATLYIYPFLEALIARLAVSSDDADRVDELTAQTVEEWTGYLESDAEQLYCCRVVSHLTTKTGEPVTLGSITILPEEGPGSLRRETRSRIPRALYEEPPHTFDPPESLVIATTNSAPTDVYATERRMSEDVDRFLLLARLLYAGTHQSCWQIAGPASPVSRNYPRHTNFGKGAMSALMQRTVVLTSEHAPAFAALGKHLDAAADVIKRGGKVATSFDVALYRFNRAHEANDAFEAVVDLATAFEATLISDGKETDAISMRLRSRAAALLVTEGDPGRNIFNDVGKLYQLRSLLVHGGSIGEKDLKAATTGLSTAPSDIPPRVSLAFAVDRLRDLVRRAFLARLCLASGPEALWPFGQSEPVDAVLADDRQRDKWRQHWRQMLMDLGVPDAAEAAVPGVDPLRANKPALEVDEGPVTP